MAARFREVAVVRRLVAAPASDRCGLSLAGCAPTYKKLPVLDEVPELRTLSERSEARQIQRLETPCRRDRQRTLFDRRGGNGRPADTDVLVVLVHGLVSDRTTWQFVSGYLGETHRLWIPDQLGCGESDRPSPIDIGEAAYGPSGSAGQLLEALKQRNDEAGWPERIFYSSATRSAVPWSCASWDRHRAQRAAYPRIFERVDSAMLIAPLEFAVHRSSEALDEMARIAGLKLVLGTKTGVFREKVAQELIYSAENPDWVLRLDVDRILSAFAGKPARLSTQAIIRQAIPFNELNGRPNWNAIESLVADYANVQVPILLLWGNRDETLPLSMGYKLLAELPDARLLIVEDRQNTRCRRTGPNSSRS